ncbi:MAG: hypothetical protein AAF985_05805 [Bacteroidota bacterium]
MEEFYSQIDAYLQGSLQGEERTAFEQQMQSDADLSRAVEEQRKAMQLLDIVHNSRLKANLQEIHQNVVKKEPPTTPKSKGASKWWGLLVVLALLLALFYFWKNQSSPQEGSPPDPKILYAEYHETYPVRIASRSQDTDPRLVEASQAYQSGNFVIALQKFEALITNAEPAIAYFATGLCHLELRQFEAARQVFQNLLSDPLYGEPTQWYLSLALLQLNDLEGCKKQLKAIQDPSEFYTQAQQLLNSLN